MYDYDDFYEEPSEFDQKVDEFKQALMNSVKEEYKSEMDRLRNENDELQKVKQDWKNIQTEYANKVRSLENEKNNLERKMRSERISELLKDCEVIMFRADYDCVYGPKCDKCDENRKIKFLSPNGNELSEQCPCAETRKFYKPEENRLKEFRQWRGKSEVIAWYEPARQTEDDFIYSSSTLRKTVYESGMDYTKLDRYDTFFRTEEECQAYCDWLTAKEADQ